MSDSIEMGQQGLPEHYVYVLADPVTEGDPEVFYVGKGRGSRLEAHEADFERVLSNGGDVNQHPKFERLQDMRRNGRKPLSLIIGRFETNEEALAVECMSIKYFFGINSLCNKVHGHGADNCRAKGVWEVVPGLDIEAAPRLATGEETARHKAQLAAAGAYEVLAELKERLGAMGVSVRGFEGAGDRAYNPGAGNGFLGVMCQAAGVDWIISFSASRKFSLTLANTLETRSRRASLNDCWPAPCLAYVNQAVNGEPRYGVFYRSEADWIARHGLTGWEKGKVSSDGTLLRARFETIDGVLKELCLSVEELRSKVAGAAG